MNYSYYAIFEYDLDGINITFPDVNTLSCARTTEEGLKMAKEALNLGLDDTPIDEVPAPSTKENIPLKENQKLFLITSSDIQVKDKKLFSPSATDVENVSVD